jgi:hypothetical protein
MEITSCSAGINRGCGSSIDQRHQKIESRYDSLTLVEVYIESQTRKRDLVVVVVVVVEVKVMQKQSIPR